MCSVVCTCQMPSIIRPDCSIIYRRLVHHLQWIIQPHASLSIWSLRPRVDWRAGIHSTRSRFAFLLPICAYNYRTLVGGRLWQTRQANRRVQEKRQYLQRYRYLRRSKYCRACERASFKSSSAGGCVYCGIVKSHTQRTYIGCWHVSSSMKAVPRLNLLYPVHPVKSQDSRKHRFKANGPLVLRVERCCSWLIRAALTFLATRSLNI